MIDCSGPMQCMTSMPTNLAIMFVTFCAIIITMAIVAKTIGYAAGWLEPKLEQFRMWLEKRVGHSAD